MAELVAQSCRLKPQCCRAEATCDRRPVALAWLERHTRSGPSSACCSSSWMRSRSCRSFAFFSFITAANWHTLAGSVAEAHMQPARPSVPPFQKLSESAGRCVACERPDLGLSAAPVRVCSSAVNTAVGRVIGEVGLYLLSEIVLAFTAML